VGGGDAALRRAPLVLHAAGRLSLTAAREPSGDAVEVG
jgi:siroheme synthase (precorrin-2 oxidase/ferrochelatase)